MFICLNLYSLYIFYIVIKLIREIVVVFEMAIKCFGINDKERRQINNYLSKISCMDKNGVSYMGLGENSRFWFYNGVAFKISHDNNFSSLTFYGKNERQINKKYSKLIKLSEGC